MQPNEKIKRVTETEQWRMFIEHFVDKKIESTLKRFASATTEQDLWKAQERYNAYLELKQLQDTLHGR